MAAVAAVGALIGVITGGTALMRPAYDWMTCPSDMTGRWLLETTVSAANAENQGSVGNTSKFTIDIDQQCDRFTGKGAKIAFNNRDALAATQTNIAFTEGRLESGELVADFVERFKAGHEFYGSIRLTSADGKTYAGEFNINYGGIRGRAVLARPSR